MKRKSHVVLWSCGLAVMIVIGIWSLGFVIGGCGQVTKVPEEEAVAVVTDYTIQGKVGTVTPSSVQAMGVSEVTHIVAIGANNAKYLATYSTTEKTFSIGVKKGWPYALGFYNKTGNTITLLGYLKQKNVSWESLPLMNPADSATNLGTVEINTSSVEAIPSLVLIDLLNEVNMSQAVANLYGNIDDTMTIFTNVDVDGNGEFDFNENKAYLLDVLVQIGKSNGLTSGEVDLMLGSYYENYYAIPSNYQFHFYALEGTGGTDKPATGTQAILKFPVTMYDMGGTSKPTITGSTEVPESGYGWSVSQFIGGSTSSTYTTPEVVPTGTYTYEVSERGSYTLKNIKGCPGVAVGLTENIVYPVLKITTNGAGYLNYVYYKWMIRKNGATEEASAAEMKAMVSDTASGESGFVQTSPTIGASINDGIYRAPKKIESVASSIDVSEWNIKLSNLVAGDKLVVAYNLNTNIDCRWYFFK